MATNEEISEFDMKSMIEMLVAKGIASYAEFAQVYRAQMEAALAASQPRAAGVFQQLLIFCSDPAREQARALAKAPPRGPAQ